MTKRTINAAIKHLGVEVQNNRDGYSYFTSIENGNLIGESVMVCYLNQLPLERWVEEAEWALKQDQEGDDMMHWHLR